MIAKFLRHAAAVLLFVSGTAAVALDTTPPPVPGYTPPPTPWAEFEFTSCGIGWVGGCNSNVADGDGDARYYRATSSKYGTFNVRVTAWSLKKNSSGVWIVDDSQLMVWDGGLGINSSDDDGGSGGQHQIDNEGQKDFLILQFDRVVALVGADFNTYTLNNQSTRDSDITVKNGYTDVDWDDPIGLKNLTQAQLEAKFWSGKDYTISTQGANTRFINTHGGHGDLWLIGASFNQTQNPKPDKLFDGFKLESLAVVPEPQTWAMMIAGFGLIGGAMRSQRRRSVALAA